MLHPIVRLLLVGTVLGTVILGVGGRLAMSAIAWNTTGASRYSFGGTMTVVVLGAVSGVAGAGMALLSAWVSRRFLSGRRWIEYLLFAALLALVTMRGLRGTPAAGNAYWYFYGLVAVYGLAMIWINSLLGRRSSVSASV
jgi:hypothetical protein